MPPFRQARLAGPSTRAGTMSTFTLGHVPGHGCSSDVFPLPAGAEMIVTASRPRDRVATRS
jgi:hypothetical protein